MRCARLVNERGLAAAAEQFGLPLRAAHTTLFPHIDLEGTRQTELARRLGVSKQAVNQLVNELVEFGVLMRKADPQDGRAVLICFTARGRRSLLEGLAVLGRIEAEMHEAIGSDNMQSMHEALLLLDSWLTSTQAS